MSNDEQPDVDPEVRQGRMGLVAACAIIGKLALDGGGESSAANKVIYQALQAGRQAERDRDELVQRLEASVSLRAQEAQAAVRSMAVLHKDWTLDVRRATDGLAAAHNRGYAAATEGAARWLERNLHSYQMVHGEEFDRAVAGALRAGDHRRTQAGGDVGQDPAKGPV